MLETSVQCYSLTLWLLNNSSSNSQNKMQPLVFLRLDAAGSRLGVFDVAKEMLPAYPRPGHPGPQSGQHPPNTMEDNNNNNNVLNDQNNNNTLEEVRPSSSREQSYSSSSSKILLGLKGWEKTISLPSSFTWLIWTKSRTAERGSFTPNVPATRSPVESWTCEVKRRYGYQILKDEMQTLVLEWNSQ